MNNNLVISENLAADSIYKRLLNSLLNNLNYGAITLKDSNATVCYGDHTSQLHATIDVLSTDFYKTLFWHGDLGLAESYMLNLWQTDNLTTLLRILTRNLAVVDKVDNSLRGVLFRLASKIVHFLNRNNQRGAKINISKHYDLGNNFFELFLDSRMMYSSAIYSEPTFSLEQASEYKLKTICDKLELKDSDHLLEIGTGWGGLAIYAAQNYNCKVTTTTISQEQYDHALKMVNNLNLSQQISVLKMDYRELNGCYDKLVSIEMIEAVGHQYFSSYFQQCSRLVRDNGVFLLQAITIAEQRYRSARDSVDFIKKHIFPGCCIPSISEIMKNIQEHTMYNLVDLQDITLDYAKTLKSWRERFTNNMSKIKSYGFDEQFIRKWLYYFSYCEAGFLERAIFDTQLLFVKPAYRTRGYIDY